MNIIFPWCGKVQNCICKSLIIKGSLICSFLFFVGAKSLTNEEILNLTKERFSFDIPGLAQEYRSKVVVKFFELEAALCLNDFYRENIVGLNLIFDIFDSKYKDVVNVRIFDKTKKMTSREFDVVTQNHIFECKSSGVGSIQNKICQFKKERNFLGWINLLNETIKTPNDLNMTLDRKNRPVLIINNNYTYNKDIFLYCNWINEFDERKFYNCWLNMIKFLSKISLKIVFKTDVSLELNEALRIRNFDFISNFNYESCTN